jgi:hypothetical protein
LFETSIYKVAAINVLELYGTPKSSTDFRNNEIKKRGLICINRKPIVMRLLLYLVTATIILTSSCTIQKRTFRNGYYISWNRSLKDNSHTKKQPNEAIVSEIREVDSSQNVAEQLPVLSQTDSLFNDLTEKQISTDSIVVKESEKGIVSSLTVVSILKRGMKVESLFPEKKRLQTDEHSERKLDLFAANSLAFAVVYGVLLTLCIVINLSEFLAAIAFLALFVSLAFAIISFIRKKRHPEKHKGTFLSIIALAILVTGIIILFGILILMI